MFKIRKLYQIAFFIFTLYVFFGGDSLNESAVRFFNSFHIFPSLNSAVYGHGSRYMAVTLILFATAAVFGRFYCSFLCPMGFLQDIMSLVTRRLNFKPGRVKSFMWPGVFVLFFTVFSVLSANGFWGWLDHFSVFGRVLNSFAVPVFNNALSPFAGYLNKTSFLQIETEEIIAGFDFYYSFIFLAALFIIGAYWPRWFCNTLCPSGALFSLIFRSGFLKIELNSACPGCKKCERNCPSGSITDGAVDYATCVTCLECVNVCPKRVLSVSFRRNGPAPGNPSGETFVKGPAHGSRRAFITGSSALLAGIFSAGYLSKLPLVFKDIKKISFAIPPGAGNAFDFFSKCSACHMCITNCPTGVLKPALFENGPAGLSKPRLDFEKSHCSYECNLCTGVCPSGALNYLPLNVKKTTAIGKVVLDTGEKTDCIPYKEKTDCGSCAEHCPTGAVHMVRQGDVFVPKIRRAFCNGCGICESVCPVTENKPIRVVALPRHARVSLLADYEKRLENKKSAAQKNAAPQTGSQTQPGGGPVQAKPAAGDFPF